jgi:chlorobactene glucosyltransferase
MSLVIVGIVTLSLLELLTWTPAPKKVRKARKQWATFIICAWIALAVCLLILHLAVWSLLIAFFALYRCINLRRLVSQRTEVNYLLRVALISSLWLLSLQIIVLAGAIVSLSPKAWLYMLAILQLAVAIGLSSSTRRHMRTTLLPASKGQLADRDLPTLTVAIPARNETVDLEACLQSLTASTYPKLEILVLDDCSQNKHTAEIIRSFAQSGVRFIAGEVPPAHWLAKNCAYQQLMAQSNSEIILFCGVDTRFEPESLKLMVEALLQKNKTMLSFIPRNFWPASIGATLIQPSRYAWEMALPRRWLNRPPVLSSCWLVKRKLLEANGGFAAVARKISPESYFARAAAQDDGYSFVQSSATVGLVSVKSFAEQQATAIRTRYPQLHRRQELAALLSLAELMTLVMPFAIFIGSLLGGAWPLVVISTLTCFELLSFYSRIVRLTYRRFLWRSLWLLPIAAVYDIGLLNYSLWQYEFNEVIWKGRNVCLPVMRGAGLESNSTGSSRTGR